MLRRELELDGPLVVGDFGGGGPPLLMVHGIGGAKINWMLLAPLLADRFHVEALDLPGFGESPLAGRSAALDSQRNLVVRYIQEVVGSPVVLTGHSMGGLISMLVASARPDLVERLVLFDPAFPPRTRSPAPGVPTMALNLMSRAPRLFAPVGSALTLLRGPRSTVERALANSSAPSSTLPAAFVEAHVEAETARLHGATPYLGYLQAWRWFGEAYEEPSTLEAMATGISAPTLLIHGELDRVVSPDAARRLGELQPGWSVRMMAGIGHNPNFEAPEVSAQWIFEWLAGGSHTAG